MPSHLITVNSRKYDLIIRKSWTCRLVERADPSLVLIGEFDSDVSHAGLGSIARGTISEEFYWLDRWYNVFRFSEPDGSFRNFYCNITMPPTFENDILDYVDLDIDVVVWPDRRVETLDEDDFAVNSARFGYPADLQQSALDSLTKLRSVDRSRRIPFQELLATKCTKGDKSFLCAIFGDLLWQIFSYRGWMRRR